MSIIIKKGTVVYLSQLGYYNFYYKDDAKSFIAKQDIHPVREFMSWINYEGFSAYVLKPEDLKNNPKRVCNLIWVRSNQCLKTE